MVSTFRSDCISRSSLDSVNSEPVVSESEPVDLAAQLDDIETRPLEQRAEAFGQLHEQLRAQLEEPDTDRAGQI